MKAFIKEKIHCPHCQKPIAWSSITRHLIKCHFINEKEAFFYLLKTNHRPTELSRTKNVPFDILIKYINKIWSKKEKPLNFYQTQFNSFYKSIIRYREFKDSDFKLFFNSVLPWKLKHPGQMNSKELCSITFPDDKELAEKMYRETMLVKNPYYKHDSSLSPFSKKFNGYKNLSDNEIEKRIAAATQFDRKNRNQSQIGYWIKKGYSEPEAKRKVSESQATFTLKKCIEKYGKEKGFKRWKERQEKWQKTLNSKPKEEIERINRAKMLNGRGYSKISQKLFDEIFDEIGLEFKEIFYATKNNKEIKDNFYEYMVIDPNRNKSYFLDFYVKDNNKIIEFDGDYWHGKKRGNQERDKVREENLKKLGFTNIFHVKECDYLQNPEKVVKECVQYIRGNYEK